MKQSDNGEVNIELNSDDSVNITTKKYIVKSNSGLEYGSFLKKSTLTAEGTVDHEDKATSTVEDTVNHYVPLSDSELFKACGGRTAHK